MYRDPPLHPDKGKKNGRCNRRACQLKLEGRENWYNTVMQAYYCDYCAGEINRYSTTGPLCIKEA